MCISGTRIPNESEILFSCMLKNFRDMKGGDSVNVVEKPFSNQKVASSIPCRSVPEQDTEPLIAPDVQCAISVNVKCKICIHCKSHICKSLWIKASAKCKCNRFSVLI